MEGNKLSPQEQKDVDDAIRETRMTDDPWVHLIIWERVAAMGLEPACALYRAVAPVLVSSMERLERVYVKHPDLRSMKFKEAREVYIARDQGIDTFNDVSQAHPEHLERRFPSSTQDD